MHSRRLSVEIGFALSRCHFLLAALLSRQFGLHLLFEQNLFVNRPLEFAVFLNLKVFPVHVTFGHACISKTLSHKIIITEYCHLTQSEKLNNRDGKNDN